MTAGGRYVVNEWLWHDLSGDNGIELQERAVAFLLAFVQSPDLIVVVQGSPFDSKAWGFCCYTDVRRRSIARLFKSLRLDSLKCRILHAEALPELPENLAAKAKPDDHYLIQAAIAVDGSVIITTDEPLKSVLDLATIGAILRDPFLDDYLR